MTDVGELVVRIKADAAQLEREMRKANGVVTQTAGGMERSFARLRSEVASLAPALSAAALVAFGKQAVDAVGRVNDLAQRTGFAATTLSALEAGLAASGSSLDEFAASVNRMNNLVGEAAGGNEEAVRAFDALGLSVERLRALSPEDQFYRIAAALGRTATQGEMTNAGMAIFGRGFASLIPLIKESNGNLEGTVQNLKDVDAALSQDTIDRIDAFGDALGGAFIAARNEAAELLATVLRVIDALPRATPANFYTAKTGLAPSNPRVSTTRPATVSEATFLGQDDYPELYDGRVAVARTSARGSNAELLGRASRAKAAADEAARSAKAGRQEIDAYSDALREQEAYQERVNEATREAARFQQELHDKLSASLTDVVFRANSARDAMLGFAESIARAAFEKRVAGPLADTLIGSGGKSGILDGVISSVGGLFGGFFADGGVPPVGVPSVVGERGPEIFVPRTAGSIVPNHKLGGTTVIVQQTINMSPGLAETVGAAVRQAAPHIAAQAQAAVFAELQRGGAGSRIAGLRA